MLKNNFKLLDLNDFASVEVSETNSKDVAIIGISSKMPMADDYKEYWDIIRTGKNCVREIPDARKQDIDKLLASFEYEQYQLSKMAYLEDIDKFDHRFFNLSPNEASWMDPNQRLFLETAWGALEDAGYSGASLSGSNTGVYLGFSNNSLDDYKKWVFKTIPSQMASTAYAGNINSIIASRLSYILNLKGPAINVDTACSSSLVAMHYACQGIQNGDCNQAIVGSVNINILPLDYQLNLGVDSTDGKTRAFDDDSSGTGSGEGVVAFFIKSLVRAKEDGDHIYAVIKGSAINQDGMSNGITAPNPQAQAEVIVSAWERAGVEPDSVSFIETHGSGTKLGDPIEIDGISKAFAKYTDRKQFCAIGAVKNNVGHLNHAAGLAGLLKLVLALKNKQLPPVALFQKPNSEIDFGNSPVYVNTVLTNWESYDSPRRCGINSFGLSGTNCHIVLEEFSLDHTKAKETEGPQLFSISAKTESGLKVLLQKYREFLDEQSELNLDDCCYTANTGRGHYTHRLVLIIENINELKKRIEELCFLNLSDWNNGDDVFYGVHKVSGNLDGIHSDYLTEEKKRKLNELSNGIIVECAASKKGDKAALKELSLLYTAGADLEWIRLYEYGNYCRMALPVYPFEKTRCWLDVYEPLAEVFSIDDERFFTYDWQQERLVPTNSQGKTSTHDIIIFHDERGLGKECAQLFNKHFKNVIEIEFGQQNECISWNKFSIIGNEADYNWLLEQITIHDITHVLHLSSVSEREQCHKIEELRQQLDRGALSLFYLNKALHQKKITNEINIILVAKEVAEITQNESLQPEGSTLFGLGKALRAEKTNLRCRAIDIDGQMQAISLLEEILNNSDIYNIAYRNGTRYKQVITPAQQKKNDSPLVREDGVYLITGGLSEIGFTIGSSLVKQNKIKIVLMDTADIPSKEQWESILSESNDERTLNHIRKLIELGINGSEVIYSKVDATNMNDVSTKLQEIRDTVGGINGVVHLSGVKDDDFLHNQSEESFKTNLYNRVLSAWVLDQSTVRDNLDFFIMSSSVITLMGGLFVGGVTAGRSYFDSFAQYRNRLRNNTKTINWPVWKEIESGTIPDEMQIFKPITNAEGAIIFDEILQRDISNIIVGKLNDSHPYILNEEVILFALAEEIVTEIGKRKSSQKKTTKIQKQGQLVLLGRNTNLYSKTENVVGNSWSEFLGYDSIDIFENFYRLGGDSIIASKIVNDINKKMGSDINIVEIFKCQSIFELSQYIDKKMRGGHVIPNPEPVGEQDYYQLTAAQRRFFVLHELNDENTSYNMPNILRVAGKLELENVQFAINELIKRHESFRTSFDVRDGEPVQMVNNGDNYELVQEEATVDEIEQLIEDFIRPFNLKEAPLLRIKVVKIQDNDYFIIFDMHHILSDAVSMAIFIKEFIALYQKETLPEVIMQYKDYAYWQSKLYRSALMEKQENYWLKEFSEEIPVLLLPTDYPRPAKQSFDGENFKVVISEEMTGKIRKLSTDSGATLYMTLLSAYYILLNKYTGQDDIVVGSLIAGRPHADFENTIGLFMNTLPLRNYPKSDKTFNNFLMEVKENVLSAFENQDYPFELLLEKTNVKRDFSRNPIFDTMFLLQNVNMPEIKIGDLNFKLFDYKNENVKLDLILEAREVKGEIHLDFKYCTKLFKENSIKNLANYYQNILNQITDNDTIRISEISLMTSSMIEQVINGFNHTSSGYKLDQPYHRLFEERVRKTPDCVALVCEERQISFAELNQRANQLARLLRAKQVSQGHIVGLMTNPNIDMIVGVLAVLKTGAAYMPIDPEWPSDRVMHMLRDSSCKLLLSNGINNVKGSAEVEIIDIMDHKIYRGSTDNLDNNVSVNDIMYVIYTSGTTGRPKGVLLEHVGLINYLNWFNNEAALTEQDKTILISSFAFDLCYTYVYSSLLNGCELHLMSKDLYRDPDRLLQYIQAHSITYMKTTPSHFNLLAHCYNFSQSLMLQSLRLVILGGEHLNVLDVERYFEKYPESQIMNHYGPTEGTIGSIATLLDKNDFQRCKEQMVIGKPISNVQIYILDENLSPVAPGRYGEIFIAGQGLARGYLNAPESQNFLTTTIRGTNAERRLYRTGDIGRFLLDGTIQLSGRTDDQVKYKGYRIELSEIEHQLLKYEGIIEARVFLTVDNYNMGNLCAYLILQHKLDALAVRRFLSKTLPEYMIPTHFIQMEKLPLTANGKIDKKALPQPTDVAYDVNSYVPPKTDLERLLVTIWSNALRVKDVGIHDNFFDMGGDSIRAIKVMAQMQEHGLKIEYKDIFMYSSIAELCPHVKYMSHKSDQARAEGEVKLIPIQKLFFETQLINPHHKNQSVMLFKPDRFDENIIKAVFTEIVHHHDTLRLRYKCDGENIHQYYDNESKDKDSLFSFEQIHLQGNCGDEEDAFARLNELQSSLDFSRGPLVRLLMIRKDEGDHLAIIIHHLVVDGVSWRTILEDFKTGYLQKLNGRSIEFESKTDSFQYWSNVLHEYSTNQQLLGEVKYWSAIESVQVAPLPKDMATSDNTMKNSRTISASLSEEDTLMLLTRANQVYNTKSKDLLVTALGLAIKDWCGEDKILINLEGHGREQIAEQLNVSRTVGWFTSIFPAVLDMTKSEQLSLQLKTIKESLYRVPNNGVGYGILKYITPPELLSNIHFITKPEIIFNFLGQFDEQLDSGLFDLSTMPTGTTVSGEDERQYTFYIQSIVVQGKLTLSIDYNKSAYNESTIANLVLSFKKHLLIIVDHCLSQKDVDVTPSDLGSKDVSIEELDDILDMIGEL